MNQFTLKIIIVKLHIKYISPTAKLDSYGGGRFMRMDRRRSLALL